MRASSTSSTPSTPAIAQVPSQEAYTKVEPDLLNRSDFVWTSKEEPHLRRKYEMLKKYPQIEKLFGYDPETKWQCIFFVLLHFLICYLVKDRSWWLLIPTAWLIGGAFVQSLTVAIHEITHGMCFEKLEHNYYFAIFCNLGMGIPSAMTFKRYHSEHHLYLGVPGYDADITTKYEGKYVRGPFMKCLHIIFLGLIYGIKPLLVSPKVPNKWEILNITVALTFDAVLVMLWGYRALAYCLIATLFGLGLHPLSGHFISEHWLTKTGQETYSYYGPANWFMFNVGYHNEHHDFPRIPCTKLPLLRVIAPEYYGFEDVIGMKKEGEKVNDDKYSSEVQTMYHLDSWSGVLWNYITTDGYTPFVRKVRTIEDHKKARKDWYSRGYSEHACSNEENQS